MSHRPAPHTLYRFCSFYRHLLSFSGFKSCNSLSRSHFLWVLMGLPFLLINGALECRELSRRFLACAQRQREKQPARVEFWLPLGGGRANWHWAAQNACPSAPWAVPGFSDLGVVIFCLPLQRRPNGKGALVLGPETVPEQGMFGCCASHQGAFAEQMSRCQESGCTSARWSSGRGGTGRQF